jgi:hypothetical protein
MLKSILTLSVLMSSFALVSSAYAENEYAAATPAPAQAQMQILQVQPGSLTHILAGIPTEIRCAPAPAQQAGTLGLPAATPAPIDPLKCILGKKAVTSGYDYYYVVQNGKSISPETESMDATLETLKKLQAAGICKI